jgi:transposase-like protein
LRRQAVEILTRNGLCIADASRRPSPSPKTLTNRVSRAKRADSPETAAHAPRRQVTDVEAVEAVLSRLRRENSVLPIERDILKEVGGLLRPRVAARCAVIKGLGR